MSLSSVQIVDYECHFRQKVPRCLKYMAVSWFGQKIEEKILGLFVIQKSEDESVTREIISKELRNKIEEIPVFPFTIAKAAISMLRLQKWLVISFLLCGKKKIWLDF